MNKTVITRIWHGRTRSIHADTYLNYVGETGIREYRSIPGNLSAKILRRKEGDVCHFWTFTEWDNMDSIRRFAGDDFEKAKYYPMDKEYLLEFEEKVIHCETFQAEFNFIKDNNI